MGGYYDALEDLSYGGFLNWQPKVGTAYWLGNGTVKIPKKTWFRVQINTAAFSEDILITTKVEGNGETGTTDCGVYTGFSAIVHDGYLVHEIPNADTQLSGVTGSFGAVVQMSAQWLSTNGGSVSAELVMTYTYTGEGNGYQTTRASRRATFYRYLETENRRGDLRRG